MWRRLGVLLLLALASVPNGSSRADDVRVALPIPPFDASPRFVGRDLPAADVGHEWRTGANAYVGLPRPGASTIAWGGLDARGEPFEASTPMTFRQLGLDVALRTAFVDVIAVTPSFVAYYVGDFRVVRDGRTRRYSLATIRSEPLHRLRSPLGRVVAMNDPPIDAFVVEPDGRAAVIAFAGAKLGGSPAFVGEDLAIAYERGSRVWIARPGVPLVERSLASTIGPCTTDETPEVRAALRRGPGQHADPAIRSRIDYVVDWVAERSCLRSATLLPDRGVGEPVRTIRYGADGASESVARGGSIERRVSVSAAGPMSPPPDRSRTPRHSDVLARDAASGGLVVAMRRSSDLRVSLMRVERDGTVRALGSAPADACGAGRCAFPPSELGPGFVRFWDGVFDTTGDRLTARPSPLRRVASIFDTPEGFAWLGIDARDRIAFRLPHVARARIPNLWASAEPIAVAMDRRGSSLVVADEARYVVVNPDACFGNGAQRHATRVVVVRAANGLTTRFAFPQDEDFGSPVEVAGSESEMGFVVDAWNHLDPRRSREGQPLEALAAIPGTACVPQALAFALEPPRIVYVDCAAETHAIYIRSVRFGDGRWSDEVEPYAIEAYDSQMVVDATYDEGPVLAIVEPSGARIARARNGRFEVVVTIPPAD